MAQSENMKKLHAAQDAFAVECFEKYKDFIGNKFIKKFGGSYQRYEEIGNNWRKTFTYAPECEEYLLSRTVTFLGTLPENNGMCRNPRFLKNLISKISEFLSVYVAKKFENPDKERNNCTHVLSEYFKEHHVFKNIMQNFQRSKEREWGLKQKAMRETRKSIKERKAKKAKPIISVHVEVSYTPEQRARYLWEKTQAKKLEMTRDSRNSKGK